MPFHFPVIGSKDCAGSGSLNIGRPPKCLSTWQPVLFAIVLIFHFLSHGKRGLAPIVACCWCWWEDELLIHSSSMQNFLLDAELYILASKFLPRNSPGIFTDRKFYPLPFSQINSNLDISKRSFNESFHKRRQKPWLLPIQSWQMSVPGYLN